MLQPVCPAGIREAPNHHTLFCAGFLSTNARPSPVFEGRLSEDFEKELNRGNLSFRIPTPLFGAEMVEGIPDAAIRDNRNADAGRKTGLGLGGKLPSIVSGNLGRFGWKAQHSNLVDFAGEAYNVEMGITNEVSKTEIEQNDDCHPEKHRRHRANLAIIRRIVAD